MMFLLFVHEKIEIAFVKPTPDSPLVELEVHKLVRAHLIGSAVWYP